MPKSIINRVAPRYCYPFRVAAKREASYGSANYQERQYRECHLEDEIKGCTVVPQQRNDKGADPERDKHAAESTDVGGSEGTQQAEASRCIEKVADCAGDCRSGHHSDVQNLTCGRPSQGNRGEDGRRRNS